ncbi:MAG: ATP-binding protein [Gammaproteobacteria bacterium]|nr:ATP-binding protein [Gammaproteobacteria bacterium]
MQDYFPSKLAQGAQFCNRIKEKTELQKNIDKGRHTVIIAPRRYGKSSLVLKAAAESAMPLASIDLFLAHDDSAVTKRILAGISQAVSQIMPIEQKILNKLQTVFNNFRVSLNAGGFSIEASIATTGFDPVDQIFTALTSLDTLANQKKKKIILFIDEFQDIKEASSSKAIQGAIRHVAQETSNIVFIFSGSNRRLLTELFDNKSKPLYMLCDTFHLERMSSKSYLPHIQKLAKKRWNEKLSDIVFNKMVSLTELHPYYVNLLCHELWKLKHAPKFEEVFACWQECYNTHEERLIAELEKLTAKQQDILKTLAVYPAIEPTGQGFVSASKTPASTINQTIRALINKDMVYKVKRTDDALPSLIQNQLRVLDPLLAYALKKYS